MKKRNYPIITDVITTEKQPLSLRIGRFLQNNSTYITLGLTMFFVMLTMIDPAFADWKDDVKDIVVSMTDIIGFIFRAVGVILGAYSVGQLILAFKNEDADSKSRASTQLVVAIALIALPSILETLNLEEKLTN